MIDRICEILGKDEASLFSEKLDHLNSVSDRILADLRQLESRPMQVCYLRKLCPADDFITIHSFIDAVLTKGILPREWMIGAVLAPDFSFQLLLQLPYEKLLLEIGHEFTHRTIPRRDYWNQNVHVGVPAVINRTTTYRTRHPSNVTTYPLNYPNVELIGQMDRHVVVRRWIAQAIGRIQNHYGLLDDFADLSCLEELVPYPNWSLDAKMALRGLIRERENTSWSEHEVPGMTGDDSWYL